MAKKDPIAFIGDQLGPVVQEVAKYIQSQGSVSKADLTEYFKTIPDAVNPEWDDEMIDNHVVSAISNLMEFGMADVAPMEGGGVLITWLI